MKKSYCDICDICDDDIEIQEWHVISTRQKCTIFKKDICAACADKILEQFQSESLCKI